MTRKPVSNREEPIVGGKLDAIYLDRESGQPVPLELNVSTRKRKPRLKANTWSQLMQEGFELLSKMSLTQHETRVLFYLMAKSEYANIVRLNQTAIGRHLGIQQSHISRAVSSLVDAGIVFKEKDDKGSYLRVSSVLAWKGLADTTFKKFYKADSERLSLKRQSKKLLDDEQGIGSIAPACLV